MELNNTVALITGAATRVGRVIALELARQGVHIAFTYLNDDEPWPDTLQAIRHCGVKAMALPMDVT